MTAGPITSPRRPTRVDGQLRVYVCTVCGTRYWVVGEHTAFQTKPTWVTRMVDVGAGYGHHRFGKCGSAKCKTKLNRSTTPTVFRRVRVSPADHTSLVLGGTTADGHNMLPMLFWMWD